MRLRIDGDAWNRGFWDGEDGKPLRSCPYAVGTTERWSWSSGYIEGDAARRGFKAAHPCSPRKRDEAAGAEPSAASLRDAAPVSAPAAHTGKPATPADQSSVENRLTEGVKIARRSGVKVRRRLTDRASRSPSWS
jgi:ribosome modulation factor